MSLHPSLKLLLVGTVCVLTLRPALAGGQQTLPDAPPITQPGKVPVPATRPNTPAAIERRRWSGIVEPGETIPALDLKDKLLFPLHEELRPIALLPAVISGGYGILKDSDPRFGTNSEGFGERVGAAALRQGSIRFFSDGLLPALTHEDPRYYRRATGSFTDRSIYAVTRVFLIQRDSGRRGFNFSDIVGRGMAAALTQTYYPEASIGKGVVIRTWGFSLTGLGGVNLFQEFWPDIKHAAFHTDR